MKNHHSDIGDGVVHHHQCDDHTVQQHDRRRRPWKRTRLLLSLQQQRQRLYPTVYDDNYMTGAEIQTILDHYVVEYYDLDAHNNDDHVVLGTEFPQQQQQQQQHHLEVPPPTTQQTTTMNHVMMLDPVHNNNHPSMDPTTFTSKSAAGVAKSVAIPIRHSVPATDASPAKTVKTTAAGTSNGAATNNNQNSTTTSWSTTGTTSEDSSVPVPSFHATVEPHAVISKNDPNLPAHHHHHRTNTTIHQPLVSTTHLPPPIWVPSDVVVGPGNHPINNNNSTSNSSTTTTTNVSFHTSIPTIAITSTTAMTDIWGRVPPKEYSMMQGDSTTTMVCTICHQRVGSSLRYASHLDKCLGIGTMSRNASNSTMPSSSSSSWLHKS
jgi:hypothetical protein